MLVVSAVSRTSRLVTLFRQSVDAKDRTKGTHTALLHSAVFVPRPHPHRERCENNGVVDLELCGKADVVLVEQPGAKPGLLC